MTLSTNAGGSATAAFVNQIAPQGVVKPTDESLASNTTLQPDNDLFYALNVANATYHFDCYLDYEGGTQGSADIKWTWAVLAGVILRYQAFYISTSGNVAGGTSHLGSDTVVAGSNGAGVLMGVHMRGGLIMSTTLGNIALSWAQNSTSVTPTIVHAGSDLSLFRKS